MTLYAVGVESSTGDYANPTCANFRCDDPAPSIDALSRLRLGAFVDHQPIMGPVSVVVRAPAEALARAVSAGPVDRYRAGAAVCLLLAIAICAGLAHHAWRRGAAMWSALAALALALGAVVWTNAQAFGHPEEALAAALLALAVALAAARRGVAAGIVFGVAIATKEWTLLGAGPLLFLAAAPNQRIRVAVIALAVAALLFAPLALGDPGRFREARTARVGTVYGTPANIWWRLGTRDVLERDPSGISYAVRPPRAAVKVVRPALLVLAFLLSIFVARRRPWLRGLEALGLLALILLLRDYLDTITYSYHHLPLLVTLASWEVLARRRFPWVCLAATVCLQLMIRYVVKHYGFDTFNWLYLAWTTPLIVYLAVAVWRQPAATSAAPA